MDNKMDVFYMDEVKMIEQINKESWEQLKSTIGDKMLYLINDLDRNAIFLIYI